MSGEDVSTLEDIVISYGFESEQEFHKMVSSVQLETMLDLALFRKWKYGDGTKAGLTKLLEQQKARTNNG